MTDMTPLAAPAEPAWHEGELALQARAGAVTRMRGIGITQVGRRWMPDQHQAFYAQLPFVVLGSVDAQGRPWATLRAGPVGFMQALDSRQLALDLAYQPEDPADAGVASDKGVGMLGIELHTRRRNRLNGVVRHRHAHGFTLEVNQAFGNCPRYIDKRQFRLSADAPGPVRHSAQLHMEDRAQIAAAQSFYVATYIEREGQLQVDVSHRGGKSGFVHVNARGVLTVPDFNGNLFFNTLGNMLVNPKAGVVFVDPVTGDLLQITGRTELLLDATLTTLFDGAERLWRLYPEAVVRRPAGLPIRWNAIEGGDSPHSQATGQWPA